MEITQYILANYSTFLFVLVRTGSVLPGTEFAGQVAGFQMGIGMASAYDPIHSAQITVLGKFLSILTLLIFLTVNGHLMLIMALKKSFDVIPPYGFALSGTLTDSIIVFSRE